MLADSPEKIACIFQGSQWHKKEEGLNSAFEHAFSITGIVVILGQTTQKKHIMENLSTFKK